MTAGWNANDQWPEVTLGDVADIVMGQSPSGDTVSGEHGVPLLNGPTEFGAHHPTPVQFTTDPRRFAEPRDILFCVRGSTTGRMNWADQEYAIGRGIAAIRHREESALQSFVRGVIQVELPGLLAEATGSTFPNLSGQQLAGIPVPNLRKDEQHAIAHILGTLDDKIELNRRMNQTLEEMARAIFQDWFVDFGPVRAKLEGREPYLPPELWDLFPDRMVDSELGEIPEGWKAKVLSEILTAKDQRVGESKVPEYSSTNTGLHPREGYFKKQLSNSVSKNKVVHSGDLVFGLSRRVLNFGLMRDAVGCVSPAYKVFSVDGGTITPDLIERLIRMRSDYYYGAISGSSREGQSISSDALKLLYILRPPASVQRAFYESSEPYSRRRAILDKETRDLTAQRDALLPNLVSGEVRFGNELLHGGRK